MTKRRTKSHFKRFGEYLDKHYPVKSKNEQAGEDAHSQTLAILNRFKQDDGQAQIHSDVFDTFMGAKPLRESPPDDMPALEKIKLYARSGYHLHHVGTDEEFERVWAEAFGKEGRFEFLADLRRERGGKK